MKEITWQAEPVPLAARIVVYQAGLVAALGIQSRNGAALSALLESEAFRSALPPLLLEAIHAEMTSQGIDTGVRDESIAEAISEFVSAARSGGEKMITRKIAIGEPPLAAADSRYEYVLNPDGFAMSDLDDEDEKRRAQARVHEVRTAQTLVVYYPPTSAKPGITVRGEPIVPTTSSRDDDLLAISGPNTEVDGERLVAAIDGVSREDERGVVRVVQEFEVEEVNTATGDLPASGVAAINVLVRRSIAHGSAVQTTEDLFVGNLRGDAGIVEAGSRIRAGNLCVRGLVAGAGVPQAYLAGEVATLETAEQEQVRSELEASLIEVEGVLAAREVIGRNINAGSAFVQANMHGAAIEVEGDLQVDGDLVGGLVICGGMVEVLGDMGNEEGTATRIRLELEGLQAKKRQQLKEELNREHGTVKKLLAQLEEHRREMEMCARRSPYWATLMNGEKRPPARPMERKLLGQFLQATRQLKQLGQAVHDAQANAKGLERLLEEIAAKSETNAGVRVLVGGTAHPGVSLEMVRPLEADDGERVVEDGHGQEKTLADVQAELASEVEHYISLYEASIEERREALDKMFEGRETRPEAPRIPDRKFETRVTLPDERPRRGDLVRQAIVQVHAHDPSTYYLKQMARVAEPAPKATISVEQVGDQLEFSCKAGEAKPTRWQENEHILTALEEIRIGGISARRHLLD